MNRAEALRILGLDEDASPEDIKVAYRETAQILHPDRFAGNKKLQDRATEQFKNLQEAYSVLTSGKGFSRGKARSAQQAEADESRHGEDSEGTAQQIRARLAGIAAARVQLAAQRDALSDERRGAVAFLVIGGMVALFCGRRPTGLFLGITAIASTAAVWGAVHLVSVQRSIATLDEQLKRLAKERDKLQGQLDEWE